MHDLEAVLTRIFLLTYCSVCWVTSMAQPAKGSTTGLNSSCSWKPIWPATRVVG